MKSAFYASMLDLWTLFGAWTELPYGPEHCVHMSTSSYTSPAFVLLAKFISFSKDSDTMAAHHCKWIYTNPCAHPLFYSLVVPTPSTYYLLYLPPTLHISDSKFESKHKIIKRLVTECHPIRAISLRTSQQPYMFTLRRVMSINYCKFRVTVEIQSSVMINF